ncbi:MAG: R3H domain-containing nucleic acid-binding protein [Cyanobacteria bacterium P01_A01_bin.83]
MKSEVSSGKEWLQQLLALMGLAAEVDTEGFARVEAKPNSSWLNIDSSNFSPEHKQLLIGFKGESIDAIQYLLNTILNLSSDPLEQSSFVVELDSYRVNRNQELATLTQEAVEKVRQTGQEVEIAGLSSAERKQIHSLLQDEENLTTESRGQEPERKLIILPQ